MKIWYYILLMIVLVSCKSKAVAVDSRKDSAMEEKTANAVNSKKIIQNHYNAKTDFSTLYIKSNAKYKDDNNTQNVSAEIKIQKDQKILISIRVLGITMAKALVTPQGVKYYEKLNGTYFDGDYQSLSQWLGTDLDYYKIQNMLIGQPIDDLTKENYAGIVLDSLYQLNSIEHNTEKSFFFGKENYQLKKQEILQPTKERKFEVQYGDFQEFTSAILPSALTINASQKKGNTEIHINYQNITFNEALSFPYSVPEGYERIFIN